MKKKEDIQVRPAINPDSREEQMISLATSLAEKQLIEGTASSQVICHYLKLGTSKNKLEREKLEYEKELLKAKTDSIEKDTKSDELYQEVLDAFKIYRGDEHE